MWTRKSFCSIWSRGTILFTQDRITEVIVERYLILLYKGHWADFDSCLREPQLVNFLLMTVYDCTSP